MVSRRVNRAVALSNENIAGFVGIEDTDDAVEVLARTLRERVASGEAIGIETGSWYLTVQAWKALSRALPNELVDWGGLIERSRTIKTPAQLGYMREAARAAVAGLDEAVRTDRARPDGERSRRRDAAWRDRRGKRVHPRSAGGNRTGDGRLLHDLAAATDPEGRRRLPGSRRRTSTDITRSSPAPALPARRRRSTGALPISSSSPSTARSMRSVPASPRARSMPRAARCSRRRASASISIIAPPTRSASASRPTGRRDVSCRCAPVIRPCSSRA